MPLFADPSAATAACRCFEAPELLRDTRMLTWVLMPDHAHWLVELGEGHWLLGLVHALKTFSARNVNLALGRSGPVWARAFHDRALRCDDDLATVAQYILANPQRAGLTRHPDEYPYRNTRP